MTQDILHPQYEDPYSRPKVAFPPFPWRRGSATCNVDICGVGCWVYRACGSRTTCTRFSV